MLDKTEDGGTEKTLAAQVHAAVAKSITSAPVATASRLGGTSVLAGPEVGHPAVSTKRVAANSKLTHGEHPNTDLTQLGRVGC